MTDATLTLTRDELYTLLEDAAEKGAEKALVSVGLHSADPDAVRRDITELRDLLGSWRGAKKGIASAIWKSIGTAVGAAILAFIAWKVGADMPK